ncbi:MAG TPA: FAD:protein FMN transferase [Solirubrobacteraceae bacterium]|nr:FAD:protein FMN transferase [Solirubrobacteraceae bacterium]
MSAALAQHALRDPRVAALSWSALGTTIALRVADETRAPAARAAVEAELAAIDSACSRFRADSGLSHLNASAGRPVRVSPLLLEAIVLALRAASLTDGAVDPTVGRALELIGYDRDFAELEPASGVPVAPPAQPGRVLARARSGWRTVRVQSAAGIVTLPAGISLDLGATAKAWAADRAATAATAAAGCGTLVAVGGDVACAGPASASGWPVRVSDDHRDEAGGELVTIRDGGLATSSTSTRRWRHEGSTMHHIIDPSTGMPAEGRWRTVSVAAGDCTDANIACTAAIVLGSGAVAWLTATGLPARLVRDDGYTLRLSGWPDA